jgi:hypothetical protein
MFWRTRKCSASTLTVFEHWIVQSVAQSHNKSVGAFAPETPHTFPHNGGRRRFRYQLTWLLITSQKYLRIVFVNPSLIHNHRSSRFFHVFVTKMINDVLFNCFPTLLHTHLCIWSFPLLTVAPLSLSVSQFPDFTNAASQLTSYSLLSIHLTSHVLTINNSFVKSLLQRFKSTSLQTFTDLVRVLLHPKPLNFRQSLVFWKVHRLRCFDSMIREACRWRCVWSFGGMILTGDTEVLREKPVTLLTTNLTRTYLVFNANRDDRPAM